MARATSDSERIVIIYLELRQIDWVDWPVCQLDGDVAAVADYASLVDQRSCFVPVARVADPVDQILMEGVKQLAWSTYNTRTGLDFHMKV